MQYQNALVWFRRDLRDFDHAALYHALKKAKQVYCVFVFDTDILDKLPNKQDRRVEFIWESVSELKETFQKRGADLIVKYGKATDIIPALARELNIEAVFANHDYEPQSLKRDNHVASTLAAQNIVLHTYKDQVLFEKDEVLNLSNKPYAVFTPYRNAALKKLDDFYLKPYPVEKYIAHLAKIPAQKLTSLNNIGFERTNLKEIKLPTGMKGGSALVRDFLDRIQHYQEARDFPAVKGVSYLSTHLRFGTVSIRYLASLAKNLQNKGADCWLNELIWRDFYFMVLHHHPHVAAGQSFNAKFNALPFHNNKVHFKAWCEGQTGYPLIDAAMRQINQTGYMHNRLRMVVASFLTKDLLIDWRWGEQYFAVNLIDFDLSANNGGWQWAASTGCDAQPWFRIFNPVTQSQRFDGKGTFIRKYVPELNQCNDKEIHAPWQISSEKQQSIGLIVGKNYPHPIVNHKTQRQLAIDLYKKTAQKQLKPQ